jgi:two-component system, NtrC family, response regulator HydG
MAATRVWVVDDDSAVRGAIETIIRELGHAVQGFDTAESALAAFEQGSPDVLIADVRMPGMNGIELTRKVVEMDPAVIVMILTAFPSIPNAVEAIRAGARDFLAKPLHLEELRLRLDQALENRRLEARFKKTRNAAWCLIASLPFWFILGMLLARALRP